MLSVFFKWKFEFHQMTNQAAVGGDIKFRASALSFDTADNGPLRLNPVNRYGDERFHRQMKRVSQRKQKVNASNLPTESLKRDQDGHFSLINRSTKTLSTKHHR